MSSLNHQVEVILRNLPELNNDGKYLLSICQVIFKSWFGKIINWSSLIRLVFGVLNPAYNSFKAVKTKNVKVVWGPNGPLLFHSLISVLVWPKVRGCDTLSQEYVHWMTYWIVLAVLTIAEEVTDILLGCWFPLYFEIKLVFLFWLISPISRWH